MCDGEFFKTHPIFSEDPTALQIMAYYDDVEVVNPLGSKTKKHKVGLFYFMLGNIPPEKRSTYQAINLIAVCKTKDLKKHGIDQVLKPFIDDLVTLGSPAGYPFMIDGKEKKFRGALLCFCGDTPASNFVSGFKEGVGGAY